MEDVGDAVLYALDWLLLLVVAVDELGSCLGVGDLGFLRRFGKLSLLSRETHAAWDALKRR